MSEFVDEDGDLRKVFDDLINQDHDQLATVASLAAAVDRVDAEIGQLTRALHDAGGDAEFIARFVGLVHYSGSLSTLKDLAHLAAQADAARGARGAVH